MLDFWLKLNSSIWVRYFDPQPEEVDTISDNGKSDHGFVEKGETLFCHLGRVQIELSGFLNRVPREFRAFVVRNRTADSSENVRPRAIIYSGGWVSYSGLRRLGEIHRRAIHEEEEDNGFNWTLLVTFQKDDQLKLCVQSGKEDR